MDRFLPHRDALGEAIQKQAENLYQRMITIPTDNIGLSEHGRIYFTGSHLKRLFFSIETSAHILYNSVALTKKNVQDIVLLDYGAGLGSLYLLAKMIGCKKVIYNDILEDWKNNALIIAKQVNINVDDYIVGNIDDTLQELKTKGIVVDILTSRNVIEHIYKLDDFYQAIHQLQPQAIIYSSTTANFNNPAMNLQHVIHHWQIEKIFKQQRIDFIKQLAPRLTNAQMMDLAKHTRGYDSKDVETATEIFLREGVLPKVGALYTNTCQMQYGVWAENIIPFSAHKNAIESAGMKAVIHAGFWDTHYTKKWKNLIGAIVNPIIKLAPGFNYLLAPFIYVIALPKTENR